MVRQVTDAMNIKIQGGGSGEYANSGSCAALINYLAHEDKERILVGDGKIKEYFSLGRDNISAEEVTFRIDHNKAKLCNSDSKFFVITVSPSQDEIRQMGNTPESRENNFKKYVSEIVMDGYAQSFGKGLEAKDILFFGKIHQKRGDKAGEQMHAHVIVSRKDINNKIKLSPQTSHKSTGKHGTVKDGFDRKNFMFCCEKAFDHYFMYERKFEDSFVYLDTMKNGGLEGVKKLAEMENEHNNRMKLIQKNKEQIIEAEKEQQQQKRQERQQEQPRRRGMHL